VSLNRMSSSPPGNQSKLLQRLRALWPGTAASSGETQTPTSPQRDFTLLQHKRFVVLDVETTGLNINKDELLSIGAIAIINGQIALHDSFSMQIKQEQPQANASTLIHGLTPNQLRTGIPADTALSAFYRYLEQAHLLAFHAPFDQAILQRSYRKALKRPFKYPFWDVADICAALFPEAAKDTKGLDAWLNKFHLEVTERHNACADALATAELMLILLRQCQREAIETVAQLDEKIRISKRLRQMSQS